MRCMTTLCRALLALGCVLLSLAARADPLDIWFHPLTWNRSPTGKGIEYAEHDFPALLKPGAPWQKADAHIAVLGLPGNVIWSYPNLPELVDFVRRHHWKFALSLGVEYAGGLCQKRYEGVSLDQDYAHEAVRIVRQWHQAGGRLDYLALDSPLHFTHYNDPACQMTIAEAARRAGVTVRMLLAEYPAAQIVDAEGPARTPNAAWLADMATWMQDFTHESGHRIDAVALDLHWRDPRPGNTWQDTARQSAAYFHRLGVATGLLVNAEAPHNQISNPDWMAQNREHIHQVVAGHLGLDFITIAQWHHHVEFNLPETDPMAYTSLVDEAADAIAAGR